MWLLLLSCAGKELPNENGETDSTVICEDPPLSSLSFGNAGQGIDTLERDSAERMAQSLLGDPNVAFVAWRNEGSTTYEVHLANSSHLLEWDGSGFDWSPITALNSDGMAQNDLSSELDAGENPNNATITGYAENDPRVSFIPLDKAVWPNIEERIAQLFEHEHSPDLTYALAPYARGGVGSHGGLSLAQSRAPLLLSGPGIKVGSHAVSVRQIDIAPTIAHLLGVEPIGNTHLNGQDGRVLLDIVKDCSHGTADYAILITLDGLSHTELGEALGNAQLPQVGRINNELSAWIEGGSIVGWPSFSFPGHLSLHTGAYQGHHGIISNSYWDRTIAQTAPAYGLTTLLADPVAAQETQETYLAADIETIFEAVGRQFPESQTASINELAFRGATFSRLASQSPQSPPPDTLEYELADASAIIQFENMVDQIGIPKFLSISLYLTDAAGQYDGPHGDFFREALIETDARLKSILDVYEDAGIQEKTLFVLTSDHGMELQDPTRRAQVSNLNTLDIPHVRYGQLIYLTP